MQLNEEVKRGNICASEFVTFFPVGLVVSFFIFLD